MKIISCALLLAMILQPSLGEAKARQEKKAEPVEVQAPLPVVAPLTPQEQQILERGEVSKGKYIGGGITGSIVGFGIGHAIQGRYAYRGWIFTVGEGAGLALIISSLDNCADSAYDEDCDEDIGNALLGYGAFVGFKIWEIVDLWVGPPIQNRRYRALRARTQTSLLEKIQVSPIVMSDRKMGLGLSLTF